MINSLPSGVELFNVRNSKYYVFNTKYGVIYEGMFVNDTKLAYKFNYRYIYEIKANKLYQLTSKERKQYEQEYREEEEYYNKHTG